MMLTYMREAQFLVEEGATPSQVDQALYNFGMAMGIFAVDDMGGLDLAWRVLQDTKRLTKPGDRLPLVLERLYAMGRLGQKTGAGWYRYEDGRTPIRDPEVEALIETTAKQARGTNIAKRMCPVASETSPIAAVNTAPPMIAMTISEAPSLVRSPRPRIEAAKIVGNMIDMKKLDSVSAPSPTPPPTIAATAQSAMLANPKIASSRSGATAKNLALQAAR